MRRAWLVTLIVYAALDFASPLVPGSVNFDDDQTILGAHPVRHRGGQLAPVTMQVARPVEAARAGRVDTGSRLRPPVTPIRRPPPQSRPRDTSSSAGPDVTGDH